MNMPLPTTHALRINHDLVLPLVPMESRKSVLLLWQLDARLGEIARRPGEPALAQIRLRWWADQLEKVDAMTSPPEPLLAQVAAALSPRLTGQALLALGEGWIAAVGSEDNGARGAALFAATADLLGHFCSDAVSAAGDYWGKIDAMAASGQWSQLFASPRVSQLPRCLAVLVNDAVRVASRRGLRHPLRDQLAILRVGLCGR